MTGRSDNGSASVELVLMTPVLIAILLLVTAFGRAASAGADVEAAARDAARAASIERSRAAASTAGTAAADESLHQSGYRCRTIETLINTGDFGANGSVTATVRCTMSLADLSGVGLPASLTIERSFTEPVDRFRGTR